MTDGPEGPQEIPDAVDRAFTRREVGREDRSVDRENDREDRSIERQVAREGRQEQRDISAEKRKSAGRFKALRDVAIFTAGVIGFLHEVFYTVEDRPFLLILTASMMGLPTAIRLDEFRRTGK